MSIVVRDNTSQIPLQDISYLDISLNDLYQTLLTFRRANCPNWTDENGSDLGVQLLDLFTKLCYWNVNHIERVKDDCHISTTNDREMMRGLSEWIGYTMGEATTASVVLTFTLESGHGGITIPAGTQVATEETDSLESTVFETVEDTVVGAGTDEIDVTAIEGSTIINETLGTSTGEANQEFQVSRISVIWQSEHVQVDAGGWANWTRVDNFVNSGSSDKHYRIEVDENLVYYIIFGDGVNGAIPPLGTNNIRLSSYRIGGGVSGNVATGTITEVVSNVDHLESVINSNAALGGTDRESMDHARTFAPATIQTLDRAVSTPDVEALCLQFVSSKYGSIVKARCISWGSFQAQVMIVPQSGGLPSAGLRAELQEYLLNGRTMVCTLLTVIDPQYRVVDISAEATILAGYSSESVEASIRANIVSFLSPSNRSFGGNLYHSDIYGVIRNTQGVDYCLVSVPSGDVIVNSNQIASIGNITLTMKGTTV